MTEIKNLLEEFTTDLSLLGRLKGRSVEIAQFKEQKGKRRQMNRISRSCGASSSIPTYA